MHKQGIPIKPIRAIHLLFLLPCLLLTGCMSGVWTGMNLVYTRHQVYKKIDDFKLASKAQQLLFADRRFKQKGASLDLAVFNGDILIAGHLPDEALHQVLLQRLRQLQGHRHLFHWVSINAPPNDGLNDSLISAKIIARIIANAAIDPSLFKIVTVDGIVYIMGDVPLEQARLVVDIARHTAGVIRVVKLLKCYQISKEW